MRFGFFLALVVATFIASCISFSNAENVAQIADIEGTNNKNIRKLAETDWWLSDTEERANSGGFFTKMKNKISGFKLKGGGAKPQKLSKQQINTLSKEIAPVVKKDRKKWPIIKRWLKILYGALLAGLIIVSVDAMLYQM
ncbi:RxLR effector protein [Phytophthora megakarya]|uniref:RxLR effector protein n=1 Tax=Phytophthora megakarya TaxID=4795 RepID=A0A225VMV9_9STRA|nr:RxLR effector protein [Phytophthora megakarya]